MRAGNRGAGDYRLTFAVLLAASAAYALLQSLVAPVLPTIQRELHTNQNTVTWVLTAYLLSASVATPILGRVGDMFGKKKMLVVTLVIFGIGALMSAVAPNIGFMIISRVIQGAGGAILPLSFGIIRDEFPREKVATAVGIAAALLAVGSGLGIVLAGPIVNALNYHFLFWLPMVVIFLAAIAAAVVIPESKSTSRGRINWLGAGLLSVWLITLLLAVSEGSTWGWTSGRTLGLFAVAVASTVAWLMAESRAAEPLIDMRMMRLRPVWTTNMVALLFGVVMYSLMAFLPAFLQTPKTAGYGFGASITRSGLFMLPMTITMFIMSMTTGRLAARVGSRLVVVVGAGITIVPFGILTFAHHQAWEILVVSALLGVGFGLAFAAMANIIVEAVPPEQTGVASGMNANIRTIGGSIGAAVMASIVTSGVASNTAPPEHGYTDGFAFLGVAAILAAAVALMIPRMRHETEILDSIGALEHPEAAMVAEGTLIEGGTVLSGGMAVADTALVDGDLRT